METMLDIATETARHNWVKQRLIGEHPDLDEETLADTLEGLTDLNEVILAALRSALDDEAHTEALKSRIDDLRARLDRLTERAKAKRRICAEAMETCSISKILGADLTVSLRARSKRVEVLDEARLPETYWKIPAPVIDRRSLGEALKNGNEIEGATLIEGEATVSVRVR